MIKLTFYGGVGEIGGNKILLEHKESRIFLDFGQSFTCGENYFIGWLQPRNVSGCKDYFEFNLLPKIKGVYSKDMLNGTDLEYCPPSVDAVLLSHAHFDHVNHIKFIDPAIPVYCGHGAKTFIEVEEDTSPSAYYGEHEYRVFKSGDKLTVSDNIEVEPIHVDHSIPGAYGFLIHTSDGTLVYTGDIRRHGPMQNMTDEFIQRAGEDKPVALISEGTRVAPDERRQLYTENQVLEIGVRLVEKSDKLVVATSYSRDIDRFRTLYEIAVRNSRSLVISTKTAYLFSKVKEKLKIPDPLQDKNILVYYKKKSSGSYDEKDYYKWERQFMNKMVTAEEISKKQKNYLLHLTFYSFTELIDIKPIPGSLFIHSMSEPFSEEDVEAEVMANWVEHFKLKFYQLHSSGHASKNDITQIIKEIKPGKIIPVHTEHPELFEKTLNQPVIKPEIGELIKI
ncbi:MAG: MBL fold metallo-hydrolase [Candidatus Odinarchaeota archaeon]